MTSSDLQELTLIGHAIYHNLLDLIVLTTGYGTLLLGIFIASHSLISKSWTRSRIVLVACLAVIFICFTLEVFGVGMVGNLIGAWLDLVQTTPGSKGGLEGQALKTKNIILPLNYTSVWLIMIITLMGDYIVAWRAWVLFPETRFVKLALVILMFIDIVINITDSTFDSIPIPRPVVSAESRAILADCLASVLSMVVNIFATGLVAWKAWNHHHALAIASVYRRTSIQNLFLLFIESGAVYFVIQLISLILELINTYVLVSPGAFEFINVFQNICTVSAAWYPIAVFLLINLDSSPVVEIGQSTMESLTRD